MSGTSQRFLSEDLSPLWSATEPKQLEFIHKQINGVFNAAREGGSHKEDQRLAQEEAY